MNLETYCGGGHNDVDDDDDDDDKGVESKEPWASCGKFKMCSMRLQRFHFPAMKRIMMMMRKMMIDDDDDETADDEDIDSTDYCRDSDDGDSERVHQTLFI